MNIRYLINRYKLKYFKEDWYCARNSNISFCCYLFFIMVWPIIWYLDRIVHTEINYIYMSMSFNFGFIPCPICLVLNNQKEIRDCEIECDDCKNKLKDSNDLIQW